MEFCSHLFVIGRLSTNTPTYCFCCDKSLIWRECRYSDSSSPVRLSLIIVRHRVLFIRWFPLYLHIVNDENSLHGLFIHAPCLQTQPVACGDCAVTSFRVDNCSKGVQCSTVLRCLNFALCRAHTQIYIQSGLGELYAKVQRIPDRGGRVLLLFQGRQHVAQVAPCRTMIAAVRFTIPNWRK